MDVATGASIGAGLLKLFGEALRLARDSKRPELIENLNAMQLRFGELVNQLQEREDRIRLLEFEVRNLRDLGELVWRDNVYWRPGGEGPFCPKCRHGEKPEPVRMAVDDRTWICPVCSHSEYTPEQHRRNDAARGAPPTPYEDY